MAAVDCIQHISCCGPYGNSLWCWAHKTYTQMLIKLPNKVDDVTDIYALRWLANYGSAISVWSVVVPQRMCRVILLLALKWRQHMRLCSICFAARWRTDDDDDDRRPACGTQDCFIWHMYMQHACVKRNCFLNGNSTMALGLKYSLIANKKECFADALAMNTINTLDKLPVICNLCQKVHSSSIYFACSLPHIIFVSTSSALR